MWSTLLLPLLLLLHFSNLPHATYAMATAHGGITVIEGSSTRSSSTSTSSSSSSGSGSGSGSGSTTTSSSMPASSSFAMGTASGQRKRHRKRNSSWYDYRNYNENTTALEWMNPCGGSYYTPSATERRRAHRPKQIFNQLKRAAGTEYRVLNNSQEQKGIDIRNMQMWSLHNPNYKFLPKLKPNSTIALKRWYRNMQTYVASFAYLRRVQVNWDRHFLKRESPIAKELKNLLFSSRSMLCELETAVNRTYPVMAPGRATLKQRRQKQLPQISRNEMNKRLKLRSKRRPLPTATAAATIVEADSIDMRFVKHHYYEFLRTMWQLLRRDSKRERQQRRQRRQRRQQRQRQQQLSQEQQQLQKQQQQQQQQQQRMQLSLGNAGIRKEFNEVSKPISGHAHSVDSAFMSNVRRGRGKRQQPLSSTATATSPAITSLSSSTSKLPSASASASASISKSTSTSESASTSASISTSTSTLTSSATLRHQRRVLRT